MHKKIEYRPDIDGLRAIAVLAVVAFHAFPDVVRGGFVGVDVFFVISGFLISGILLKALETNTFSIAEFYARRIKRIFPALVLVLTACLALGWFSLFADEYSKLGYHTAAGASFVSNFALWKESGYFDSSATTKPLLHLWSLGIEEQFYLTWPVILFVLHRAGRRSLSYAILAMFLVSFCLGAATVYSDQVSSFYSPLSRFWELLIGCSIASNPGWADKALGERSGNFRSSIGIVLICVSIAFFNNTMAFPGWLALFPVVGTFLLVSSGPNNIVSRRVLSCPWLVKVGLISFPLYLWHWPALSFAYIIESGSPSLSLRVAAVIVSFVFAWLTYKKVEISVRGSTKRVVPLALAAAMVGVGAIGFAVNHSGGLPDRNIQASQKFDVDRLLSDRLTSIPFSYCHWVSSRTSFESYKSRIDRCLFIDKGKRNILVLGDSHAFDLWSGLRSAYKNVNWLQITGGGCMPVENGASKECDFLIQYVKHFKDLRTLDAIVISARWSEEFRSVIDEVKYFESLGVPVIIFGPTFEFSDDVPKILGRNETHQKNALLSSYLIKKKYMLDEEMKNYFRSENVHYVSKIDLLCQSGMCPAVGDHDQLLVIDYGHWSVEGARYFGDVIRTSHALGDLGVMDRKLN